MRGLLTAADVRGLLAEFGLAPHRDRGQNFVTDHNTVRKVVRDAGVTADDAVVEVGAGLGSLTLALAGVARRVVAIEVDAGMVRALRKVLDDAPNVELLHADALRADLASLAGPDAGAALLVANLPYNVATPLVFHALDSGAFVRVFVMVQREVGERWAATLGHAQYGAVSVKLALRADVELVAPVPRTVFHPPPRVDSVTVRLLPHTRVPAEERVQVTDLVERGFAHRRKTLAGGLRELAPPADLRAAFAAADVAPLARAEELDVAAWRRLAAELRPAGRTG